MDLREWLKAHASSPAGQRALESLGELEAPPTGLPASLTSAPGGTVVPAGAAGTMELPPAGRRATATGRTLGATARVGASALHEITQIGKVCHERCAIYYQAGDCVMPKEGIFAEVISEGEVKVGDEIIIGKTEARNLHS